MKVRFALALPIALLIVVLFWVAPRITWGTAGPPTCDALARPDDADERPGAANHPLPRSWKLERDKEGRVVARPSPRAREARYEYTPHGQLEAVTYPDGTGVSYTNMYLNAVGEILGNMGPHQLDLLGWGTHPARCGDGPDSATEGKPALNAPVDRRSLEKFVAECERKKTPYKLSLKRLARECRAAREEGTMPEDLRYLKGFTWFFGFALDRKKGDIVLLGIKDPERPRIDIDSLVCAMQAASAKKTPLCSLDPVPDPRFQKVVVDGVPWKSAFANIMVQADYEMKEIAQGQKDPKMPGLQPWFDLMIDSLQKTKAMRHSQVNRWWFNRPRKDVPRTVVLNRDIVLLYENPVVLMTEQEVDGRFRTGKTASEAQMFAEQFTNKLPDLGCRYRSIGELLALYRVLDLMAHVRVVGEEMDWPDEEYWFRTYRSPCSGPPLKMKTLTRKASHEEGNRRYTYEVRGGVCMPLTVDKATFCFQAAPDGLRERLLAGL